MKNHIKNLITLSLSALFLIPAAEAQKPETKYGNVPDMLFPYDKYQKAYKYHFVEPMKFYGYGREIPEPKGLKEVRIGFLGPLKGSVLVPYGTQMLNGAQMAIDEANSKGGYKGIPYKLMIHNDVGLWGAAANEVVKMDDEKVWAWLGSIDDIVSHVAIRATLKLEIPMVCPGDPDPTFTETNIPWVIRVISDDRQSSYALSNYVYNKDKHKRVAVIRANNRYGRVGILHYNHSAVHFGFPTIIEERFSDGETDFTEQIKRMQKGNPDAIVMWGNPKESALILNQIRAMGMKQPVYASDRIVNPIFLETAGKNAEGVISTCQYNPSSQDPKYTTFKAAYIKKYGMEPDVFAVHAYDGMNLILTATKKVGLNRALIRDVLTDMKTFQGYEGASGKIIFDATWNDIGQIYMARVENGKFVFFPTLPLERTDRSQEGSHATGNDPRKGERSSGY
jgi:branched-chain amino acid transport system substrate-binding protein